MIEIEKLLDGEKELEKWFISAYPEYSIRFYPVVERYGMEQDDMEHVADAFSIFDKDENYIFEEWYRGWGNFKEHKTVNELQQSIIKACESTEKGGK